MKSKLMDYVRLSFLFTLIYVILNENLSLLTVGLGVGSGVSAILLTNKILEIDYVEMFHINLWLVLTYFWIIFRDTYVMGWDTIVRTVKGEIKPNFFSYRSELNDEFLIVLLANAITMPPGTVVVDRNGNEMTILSVGIKEEDFIKETREKIEPLFKRFDSEEEG